VRRVCALGWHGTTWWETEQGYGGLCAVGGNELKLLDNPSLQESGTTLHAAVPHGNFALVRQL
jgi:hypothetical protein